MSNMNEFNKSREAADRYANLAERLQAEGLLKEAELGFEAAALIDSADSQLQLGWGGPFNGQKARCELIKKIIQMWEPAAVVETGTFRGITTEWLADITTCPIYTCEKNKRYFLQARRRLENKKNVHISLEDSRKFISKLAGTELAQKRVLFYLDAHWEQDLPLREEITLIFNSFEHPCVVVDDFRVPFDTGYSYDDYGKGKVLSLEILEGLLTPEIQVAFPSTPSALDSGARRGALVLMRKDSTDLIASTNLIRVGDPRDWRVSELEIDVDLKQLQIEALKSRVAEMDWHLKEGIKQIEMLTSRITELDWHCEERMKQITELTAIINKSRKS